MPGVSDPFFNSIFISYAHANVRFAKKFKQMLWDKLDGKVHVWMDVDIPYGKEWRQEILRHLNSTALVVVIVSPDAIQSSWVMYEWHYSLLRLEDEPFLVYWKKCDPDKLKLFMDYQLKKPLNYEGALDLDSVLENIAKRLKGLGDLKQYYEPLVRGNEPSAEAAADILGNVSADLSLAAANYLIAALEYRLERNHSGYVLAYMSTNLGRLRKRKAALVVYQCYLAQSTPEKGGIPEILNPIRTALMKLSFDEPL